MPIPQPIKQLFGCLIFVFLSHNVLAYNKTDANNSWVEIKPIPDWVEQLEIGHPAQKQEKEQSPKSSNAAVQYQLIDYQFNISSKTEKYQRTVLTLTNDSAIAKYSDIRIPLPTSAGHKLVIHQVNVIRAEKLINDFEQDMTLIVSEQDGLVIAEARVKLSNTLPGDQIDYSYSIIGPGSEQAKFSNITNLAQAYDIDVLRVRLLKDASRHISYQTSDPEQLVDITTLPSGLIEYQIKRENVKAIESDGDLPSWYSLYPNIQFSEYQSWQQVQQWAQTQFRQLAEDKALLSDELAAYINELRQLPKRDALNRAINFCQNEIALYQARPENTQKAQTASQVFQQHRASWRGKAVLLQAILAELEINSNIALVSTKQRQHIVSYLASDMFFDHALIKIELDQQSYWIDPSRISQASDIKSKYQPDYGLALLVNNPKQDDKSALDLVNASPTINSSGKIDIEEKFSAIDFISPVEWKITSQFSGIEAERLRNRANLLKLDVLSKSHLDFYSKVYPEIKITHPLTVEDNRELNKIKITEWYLVPGFWRLNHNGNSEFYLQPNYSENYLELPLTIERSQPLAANPAIEISHKVKLQLPEHIDFSADNHRKEVDTSYLSFSSKVSYDRRQLMFENHYKNKPEDISPEQIPEYVNLLKDIGDRMTYSNSITNVTKEPGYKEFQKLVESLNQRRFDEPNPEQTENGQFETDQLENQQSDNGQLDSHQLDETQGGQ